MEIDVELTRKRTQGSRGRMRRRGKRETPIGEEAKRVRDEADEDDKRLLKPISKTSVRPYYILSHLW
ncbi:hypothetical protein E2562_012221 [Oryza meyeriana var. granulata]|uniref:Uncharacterized protein n=1 Tax=Oryza meyeriana var. granulata TaxID=110450 RepID=A0A6G1D2H4_9ORYZ|nr:hypothetical protein E2562_012221 [Oryza meyeriana var. granulata]